MGSTAFWDLGGYTGLQDLHVDPGTYTDPFIFGYLRKKRQKHRQSAWREHLSVIGWGIHRTKPEGSKQYDQ